MGWTSSGCKKLEAASCYHAHILRAESHDPIDKTPGRFCLEKKETGRRWLPDVLARKMGIRFSPSKVPLEVADLSGRFGNDGSHCDEMLLHPSICVREAFTLLCRLTGSQPHANHRMRHLVTVTQHSGPI